jgi:hypothetical protein
MNLSTLGIAAGALGLAYLAFGKKARFLGDKVEVGDAVAVPLSASTQKFADSVFGVLPPGATDYVFWVDAAGPDVLSGRAAGLQIGPAFVPFPRQAFLDQEHVMLSGFRKDVKSAMRHGRLVVL